MISIIEQSGNTSYGVKKYIVDTEAEISTLPTTDAMDSRAFAIDTSSTYMLNGLKQWVKINSTNSMVASLDGGDLDKEI